jgi:hypothetical protein
LNDWSFAFANGSLAFAYATSKPKNENYRTHCNQQFSHGASPSEKAVSIVVIREFTASAKRPHPQQNRTF